MMKTDFTINSCVRAVFRAVVLGAVMLAISSGVIAPRAALAQAAPANTPVPAIKSAGDVKSMLTPMLPADAAEITKAMSTAKVGETITIRGNIAMSKDAFAQDRAMFTLVDEAARKGAYPTADKLPENAGEIAAAGRATIQIADAAGRGLPFGLSGEHGLKPGAEVFVTGTVATANGKDALVISATSMHVPRGPLPLAVFTDKPAENARDVSEVRKAGGLKVGDGVVLRGRIGGSKEPFVAGRAVFTLIGRGLKACNENPDDKCSKPWDYCCETKQDILANSVTVQVVDAKGQILRTDMKGRRGLKELSEVVVVGKVASADGKAVVINASSLAAVE